jgi:hypothetical protein
MNARNPYAVGAAGFAPLRRGSQPAGMISGPTPGRADRVPMKVRNRSFVIPADIPSALGQGNSQAGAEILSRMFATRRADGGDVENEGDDVPIRASHGEFLVDPETVREIGHGSLAAGYRVLEKFVLRVRKEHIATLKGLKGPQR